MITPLSFPCLLFGFYWKFQNGNAIFSKKHEKWDYKGDSGINLQQYSLRISFFHYSHHINIAIKDFFVILHFNSLWFFQNRKQWNLLLDYLYKILIL